MTAVAIGFVAAAIWWRRGGDGAVPALSGWALLAHPIPALAAIIVVLARRRWVRAVARTRDRAAAASDAVVLADLVALGLTAGRTVRSALAHAAPHLHPGLSAEVRDLGAAMDRHGAAGALAAAGGTVSGLARVVASAAASGAPVAAAVAAHADTLRRDRHAAAVTAARRLPVRLLLPLALLILPGFVVLAVGPAVIQALARLGPIP